MQEETLATFARDVGRVSGLTLQNVHKAVEVTARNIKDAWAEGLNEATGRRLGQTGISVDYDLNTGMTGSAIDGAYSIEAEIGPNLDRAQGPFAGWFEEGRGADNIPDVGPGQKALEAYEDDFERGIARALGETWDA